MAKRPETASVQVVLRVQPETIRRVDALRVKLPNKSDVVVIGRITRSGLLKVALAEGLTVLEQRYK